MDLQTAITNRRTIHTFHSTKVSQDIIDRAIILANHAPCHRLTFPWRFTNIVDKKRKLLFQLQLKIKFGDHTVSQKNIDRISSKMLNPSHLIVASQINTDIKKQKLEDYAACACAIQNLCLSLSSDGVGSKWSTGEIASDLRTYDIAQIDPNKEKIIGFIWIGYGTIPAPIVRPPISLIFRGN